MFPLFIAVLKGFSCYTFLLVGYVLLDIIQSTKMATFQVVFEWGIKRSNRDWEPANRGAEEPQECFFFYQKLIDGECRVTWNVVMVQHPSACNAWSHMCHPFPRVFQGLPDKKVWQCVLVAHIPCGRSPDCQKNKWASMWFWICSLSLSWDGESLQCATPDFGVLSRGRTSKIHDSSSPVITRLEFWLPLKAVQKIKTHIPPTDLLLSREVLWNHLGAHISHVQILC